jgi:hypothetical protein
MIDFTPVKFVAGCVNTTRNARESAWHAAVGALDTEAVKLIVSEHKGKTWYVAAPSCDFASYPDAGSSLASALPGAPGHQGAGAYIGLIAGRQTGAIIIPAEGPPMSFAGEREEAEEFARIHGASIYEASEVSPWEGYEEALARESRRLSRVAMNVGVAAAIPIFAIWIALGAASGWSNARIDKLQGDIDHNVMSMVAAVNANMDSPARASLQEIQALAAKVLAAKGVIPIYQIKNGQTSWEMLLPQWVNEDYYKQFGKVSVSLRDDNRVSVTKGNP